MKNVTLATINQRNSDFWSKEALRTQMRASDPAILEIALKNMDSFRLLGFPVNQTPSFDYLLLEAEKANKIALKSFCRRGGKAPKPNALQELIDAIAKQDPNINEPELREQLAGDAGAGVDVKIDKPSDRVLECDPLYIHYIDQEGRRKMAPLSGLKDRLYRAKRKIERKKQNSR